MASDRSDPDVDRRLVETFVRLRDDESFAQLYRAHTPALFRMAWRFRWMPVADAADLVQDTWLRAVRRLAEFRFQSSLRTWLTSILINCMRERMRRSRDTAADMAEVAAPQASPVERVDLERAVAALPPGMREVFLLFDVEGFTHAEIAELLEIETGTSKSQLFRARQKLRETLASDSRPIPFGKTRHGH
jgi:RNA polymerase sigma-70 factor (ECF subfamily)